MAQTTAARIAGSFAHIPYNSFHALLIGNEHYTEQNSWPTLSGARLDMDSMDEFLRGAFSVPEGEKMDIRILRDATSEQIVESIRQLANSHDIKENDAILIYYAGHGSRLPPPEGWPGYSAQPPVNGWSDDADIQCVVGVSADVKWVGKKYYSAVGVVPDRTLNALLLDLADKKGNNITVILDCCHSSSGTRGPGDKEVVRGVEFRDPSGNRVTIASEYDEDVWGRYSRGPVLDYEYRHAGLGSHVLISACGAQESASDGFSLTKALIPTLKKHFLDALSYSRLMKELPSLGDYQHPVCEGNSVKSMILSLKEAQLGRLAFDVIQKDGFCTVAAGSILGIVPGTKFAIYTSKATSLREELVGHGVAGECGPTSCILTLEPQDDMADLTAAIASPVAPCDNTLPIHIADDNLQSVVKTGLSEENAEDQYGRPSISVFSTTSDCELALSVEASADASVVVFTYTPELDIHKLGHTQLLYKTPTDPTFIRRVLRAAAHFFQYLRISCPENDVRARNFVDVRMYELKKAERAVIEDGEWKHPLVPSGDAVKGVPASQYGIACSDYDSVYEVGAAPADGHPDDAPRYGIELTNKLKKSDLFAWVFFFDCSTLQITQLHEPRVTTKSIFDVDPTLPGIETPQPERRVHVANAEPVPVALNYRNGPGQPLKMQLRSDQMSEVGFLRIFVSTTYHGGGLASIMQAPPLDKDKDGAWRGAYLGGRYGLRARRDAISGETEGVWDVITVPLIQTPVY